MGYYPFGYETTLKTIANKFISSFRCIRHNFLSVSLSRLAPLFASYTQHPSLDITGMKILNMLYMIQEIVAFT